MAVTLIVVTECECDTVCVLCPASNETWDAFGMIFRITIPENEDEYLTYISRNQSVYHIFLSNDTGAGSEKARKPFEPRVRNTSTGLNESAFIGNSLQEYSQLIIDYVTGENMRFIESQTLHSLYSGELANYGFSCIEKSADCAGDNRGVFTMLGYVSSVVFVYVCSNFKLDRRHLPSHSKWCAPRPFQH